MLLLLLLVGCGGTVQPADTPPVGTIWFGTSFDPKTFAMTGRTTTVSPTQPFALVGRLPRQMALSEVTVRASLNGTLVNAVPVTGSEQGDVLGFPILPVSVAGEWRYDFVDGGGNLLASGTVTAR